MVKNNRISRYLLYAIGEIILVVIGILIALQINNWNEKNKTQSQVNNYLIKVNNELAMNIRFLERQKDVNKNLIAQLKSGLNIISSESVDSVPQFKSSLGALGTDYTIHLQLPNTEGLLARADLLNEKEDSLTYYLFITKSRIADINNLNSFSSRQYSNSIESYFYENINYSEVALPDHQEGLISGGKKTDFQALKNDLKLWNLLTFKLETCIAQQERLENTIELFKKFQNYLNRRLQP